MTPLLPHPAPAPRPHASGTRMVVVDPKAQAVHDGVVGRLTDWLRPRDLLVVNDAATLPASLPGTLGGPDGPAVELRLTGGRGDGVWQAVVFGAGDWRMDTDHRPRPEGLGLGAAIHLGPDLVARVRALHADRLVSLEFDGPEGGPLAAFFSRGAPIQYSYLAQAWPLAHFQTVYAGRPVAAEMPSAGRPLGWSELLALRAHGVDVFPLTHAAGISATGSARLDALLPLPEQSHIPIETVRAIGRARHFGGRVIAVGTSVVRALEGRSQDGVVRPGTGLTDLIIGPHTPLTVVDGLLSGVHVPGESHHGLLRAFADDALLDRAVQAAAGWGYQHHEFGDAMLILPG